MMGHDPSHSLLIACLPSPRTFLAKLQEWSYIALTLAQITQKKERTKQGFRRKEDALLVLAIPLNKDYLKLLIAPFLDLIRIARL